MFTILFTTAAELVIPTVFANGDPISLAVVTGAMNCCIA